MKFMLLEFVGGPLDGHREPFVHHDGEELHKQIMQELEADPLAHTGFECPPPVLEGMAVCSEYAGKEVVYAFGIPWRTDTGCLRVEYVNGMGREGDSEFALA